MAEVKGLIADVRTDIATSKSDMTRLMFIMFFSLAGLMFAFLKLF